MNIRVWCMAGLLVLGMVAVAQEPGGSGPAQGQEQGQEQGTRGRGWGRGRLGADQGVMGTVTQVAADHFTVKNEAGETWTVNFSANTHIMKQPPRAEGASGGQQWSPGSRPQSITPADIKAGDEIMAAGEVNQNAKSVGALMVMQLDPERAKQLRQMRADYGKTWLAGRVTDVKNTTISIQGGVDKAARTFVADENTTFRRRREPITLADIHVGDRVRVEGSVKDGQFVASSVSVMVMPPASGGPVQRTGPPPQ